jgi:site-specific recombinase XerC
MLQEPGHALDLVGANKNGHQLFFANINFHRRGAPPLSPEQRAPWKLRDKNNLAGAGSAVDPGMEPLFDMAPDPAVLAARLRAEERDLTRYCAAIVREHATKFGWSKRQRNDVTRSLRMLQVFRSSPTAKIRATDVLQLRQYSGNVLSTIDVLAAAGLLIEDRPTAIERYFAAKTSTLPPVMKDQLEVWLQVLSNGSLQAPRQVPRNPRTIKAHILGTEAIIHAWADAGIQSLAEVTRADVIAALEETPTSRRHIAGNGLKSLFKTLKGRRLIFVNPTRGMKASPKSSNIPLALDAAVIRKELNSPNPVAALAVALVAFHALTGTQLCELRLTDIRDGHLILGNRDIPLAAPVRTRLATWLDQRNQTWPNSANPHLLINRRTAPRLLPVGKNFPWTGLTLRPRALREDRILHEIHATGGDVRRICDLFGLSVEGATRYLSTVEHPDLTHAQVPRT